MDFQEARTRVGVDWYTPLNNLYRTKPTGCEITEVGRGDGRLRVTVTGATPSFVQIIMAAEDESARTCEDCGNKGGHRREMRGGKILTLCDACEVRTTERRA